MATLRCLTQSSVSEAVNEIIGKPFSLRGRGPHEYDCVGVVLYVIRRAVGLKLPDPIGPGIVERVNTFRSFFEEQGEGVKPSPCDVLHTMSNSNGLGHQHLLIFETDNILVSASRELGVSRVRFSDIRSAVKKLYRLQVK